MSCFYFKKNFLRSKRICFYSKNKCFWSAMEFLGKPFNLFPIRLFD